MKFRATRKYQWEEVESMCGKVLGPFWISVEGTLIPLENKEALAIGCQVVSAYHNWLAYNAPDDDGFIEDMQEREQVIAEGLGM